MRTLVGTAFAALLCTTCFAGSGHAAPANCPSPLTGWNFVPPTGPGAGATDFEVFLPGNQVGCATEGYNSFLSPPHTVVGPPAIYDPVTNETMLTFSGPANPATSPAPFHFGFGGFVPGGLGGERLPPVAMEYTYPIAQPFRVAPVGIIFNNFALGGPTQWVVLFMLSEFPDFDGLGNGEDGDETTNWFEFPFQGKYSFQLVPSGGTVEVSNAEFFISDTPVLLDQLNFNDTPPSDPRFMTLPGFPRIVPEPASLALLGVGLLGLAGLRRRR